MNKKIAIILGGAMLFNTTLMAQDYSERSLVKRSFTLKDNEIQLNAATGYGKTDGEHDWLFGAGAAYGITDNFSVGLGGLRYKLLGRVNDGVGLEITAGGGIKDMLQRGDDDILGYGYDVSGKYVFNSSLALTFGAEYVFWNDVGPDNKNETRYSAGILFEPISNITLIANYTYRDLDKFVQKDANAFSVGVNYTPTKRMDVGVILSYSDFDAVENGFAIEDTHKNTIGAYVNYRF